MNAILIKDRPFLRGRHDFTNEPIIGLQVGDRVTKIGIGGGVKYGNVTSSARLDIWLPWIEYAGTIIIDGDKWLAFKLPPGGVTDITGAEAKDVFYKLYAIADDHSELLVPKFASQSLEIFRATFELFNDIPADQEAVAV